MDSVKISTVCVVPVLMDERVPIFTTPLITRLER